MSFFRKYRYFAQGLLTSYSQVFFSDNLWFALLLVLATFLVPSAGLAALAGVILALLLAEWLGYDKGLISKGLLSYNVVLVSLPLGLYFEPGLVLLLTLVFAVLLTFFLTVAFRGWMMRYQLPFLSWPFVISLWVVMLAARQFSLLEVSDAMIFSWNRWYDFGGINLVRSLEWLNNLPLPQSISTYLISLGAVFFQYSLLGGLLTAIGLLIYSRIAFLLSLLGFFSAFLMYQVLGLDINMLNHTYIGFNFILMSIAIGGFYLIPSRASFAWVILLVPLVTFISVSMERVLEVFQLSIYALPFNLIVPLFLYVLHFRQRKSKLLQKVVVQHNTPEKNLYAVANYNKRLAKQTAIQFKLPVMGKWTISQGHNGEFTHQGDWRHAWDFVKTDADENTFIGEGLKLMDYLCYEKPVFSSGDGYVDSVVDGIPDNEPGDTNTRQNWGNTVIVRHAEGLYSKYSHLKAGTIKVVVGQYVVAGDELGWVGNSGRSPEPHLHFQFQATPYIDSRTLDLPFSHYLSYQGDKHEFRSFTVPERAESISNTDLNTIALKAYHLIPGQRISGILHSDGLNENYHWEVETDVFNNSCLVDKTDRSKAWFVNDGQVFYFTHFEGKKNNALYYFFLSQFQVPMIHDEKLRLFDSVPLNLSFTKWIRWFQDWLAPFYLFLETRYTLDYVKKDDDLDPQWIELKSKVSQDLAGDTLSESVFETRISNRGLFEISWRLKGKDFKLEWKER